MAAFPGLEKMLLNDKYRLRRRRQPGHRPHATPTWCWWPTPIFSWTRNSIAASWISLPAPANRPALARCILRFDRANRRFGRPGLVPWRCTRARRVTAARWTARALAERQVFSVCGAATVFSRPALEKLQIGGEYYDEDFFMFWEDFDIGWRAGLLGLQACFAPTAIAYHFRSATLTRIALVALFPGPGAACAPALPFAEKPLLDPDQEFPLAPRFWRTIAVCAAQGPAVGRRIDNPLARKL